MHIPPELEKYVQGKVAAGEYQSTAEAMHVALQLLQEHDLVRASRLVRLREDIQEGIRASEEGRVVEDSAEVLEGVKRRGRERLAEMERNRKAG